MTFQITYNKRPLTLRAPGARVIGPRRVENRDGDALIRNAFQNPLDGSDWVRFLKGKSRVLIVVNDADRATPTARILRQIRNETGSLNFDFLIATGSHPPPSESDLRTIFGDLLSAVRGRLHVHDCRNTDETVRIGVTSRGTPVRINRRVLDADGIVAIGSVEPHYFAGFTGGRKSFLPGTAGFESIERNHKLALEPGVDVAVLEGNPVHEDMAEAAEMLGEKPIFSIQAVLDAEDRIAAVYAGPLKAGFRAGVKTARDIYCVPVRNKADVIVTAAEPPLDKNLYQAHKAIENVRTALKPGGVLILAAACPEGIGNDAFARLLAASDSPGTAIRSIRGSYRLGHHKAARIASLVQTARLWAVTELCEEVLLPLFIQKKSDVQSALDEAVRLKPGGDVLIVRAAACTVPVLSSG